LIIGSLFIVGFLFAFYTLISRKAKFVYIEPLLRISRLLFWDNAYLLLFSLLFSVISIGALLASLAMLSICLTRRDYYITPAVSSSFLILEILWTHGLV
jgi:hypothetical protein